MDVRTDSSSRGVTAGQEPVVTLGGARVVYGPTVAVDGLSIDIRAGEVIGLVGANGAGKSTLMRVICGATRPQEGTLRLDGREIDLDAYGMRQAHLAGIRTVWQELSLCQNLTVAENYFVEQPDATQGRLGWRKAYGLRSRESLVEVFPGMKIPADGAVGTLPIGQRQMIEIARAASAPGLKLLILDEPTSSLDAERSQQLRDYLRSRAADGLAVVFISHKLAEVLDVADRIFVMRNGCSVLDRPAVEIGPQQLVEAMGGGAVEAKAKRTDVRLGNTLAWIGVPVSAPLGAPVELRAGEIVGVAGLEGEGQKDLMDRLFMAARSDHAIKRNAPAAYVSGDRAREGVFPLWPVLKNISIGRVAARFAVLPVSEPVERAAAVPHAEAIDLDRARLGSNILELSGGNQQKALAARALAVDSPILLLEDPTRGVDISTKQKFYDVARACADSGKLVVWHTTEDAEFAECDRVLVMGGGQITADLSGDDISEERILAAGFEAREIGDPGAEDTEGVALSTARGLLRHAALLGLVLICASLVFMKPLVASVFGMELLLGPAVALTLIALAQMFIVGGSEIDLGVGAFAGLTNVLSATLLVSAPVLGIGALLAGLAGYALMAVIIRLRAVPAIVVTLGASFIWYGMGYSIQPAPGGSAPSWLRALTQWDLPGVPTPLVLILVSLLAAVLIHRSRLGTVLRGFGANAMAMERSGWSTLRYSMLRYVIAGCFAGAGGLVITAINGASDVNAGGGYTLLAVAAVVLGGCQLMGGVISPVGVTAGAVMLSLIGALLGSLGISTDYNAAVQGFLMITVLAMHTLVDKRGGER